MLFISMFLLILLPVLLIYALIKPDKFNIKSKNNLKGRWSRGKFAASVAGLWFAVIIVMGMVAPDATPTSNDEIASIANDVGLAPDDYEVHDNGAIEIKSQVEDEPELPPIQEKTFGITPSEFATRLSAEIKEVGLGDTAIGEFNIEKGDVNDAFTEMLSDAIAMNGTVDKNGELKSITFIMGQTENGDTEIMNMVMMAGLSARAISPNQPKEQSAGALTEVVVEAVEQFGENGDGSANKTVGDVKYSSLANSQMGIWAVIEAA